MKIRNLDSASSILGASLQEEKKVKKSFSSSFKNSYDDARENNEKEYLKKKLDEITKQGEIIKNQIGLENFVKYRQMVADFLEYTTKNSYKFSKESNLSRNGNYKMLGIINKINDDLAKLSEEIINDEKDNLNIIDKITGIQGMLMDLLI